MDKSRTGGEWERMVSGRLYTPTDPEIAKRHRVGMRRCDRFNRLPLWRTVGTGNPSPTEDDAPSGRETRPLRWIMNILL